MLVVAVDQLARIPVSLVFSTGSDWFQALVGLHTRSSATHVAIGIGDQLLHSRDGGVVIDSRSYWFGERRQKLIAEFQILPDVDVRSALGHVGKQFGVVHVLKTALLRKLDPFGSLGPDRLDQLSCGQLVLQLDPDGDRVPEWRYLWREAIAPVDLLEVASWGPSFRRIA